MAVEAEEVAARREVKWYLPEGLVVSPKPTKLDDKLVGSLIFMRWDAPHGWLVGKVTEMFTPATPRLFAKFNYRVKWIDGWENHKLLLDNYMGGPTAPYKSWVLLEKEVGRHVRLPGCEWTCERVNGPMDRPVSKY